MCSPSNSETRPLAVHCRGNEDQARKGRRDNICLQKKTPVQAGKRKTPLRQSNTPTERTCLLSTQNLCTAKQVHGENLCHHKDVWRLLVDVRCHCTDAIKNFPLSYARCVFELTSHLARHVTTLYLVECGSVRNDNWCRIHAKIIRALHAAVDVRFGHHGTRTKNSRRRTMS